MRNDACHLAGVGAGVGAANVAAVASADDVVMMLMLAMFPHLVFAYKKTFSDYGIFLITGVKGTLAPKQD